MVKPFLAKELNVANEETIIELMVQVFSKKLIIDTLLEYTDEDARIDIIENQNSWNKQIIFDINYN
jgi:mannitol/fructose-specific phosphotransferase system IIA component (Ntr-type)